MYSETDYLNYVLEFSLALFAISAAYFIDPARPLTFGFLLLVPLLFGYTAYISREGFKHASMLSFISLIFLPLDFTMAAVAITVSVGNVLTSFFAGGTGFKNYYSATMLPLLFTGLVLGGSMYLAATTQPDFGNQFRDTVADQVGNQTKFILEETEFLEMQKQANTDAVKQISYRTFNATELYILNQTRGNLSEQDQQILIQAFDSAEEDVAGRIVEAARKKQENATEAIDIPERASQSIENLLSGQRIALLAPLIILGVYSLHPLVGLLTAISAKLFEIIGRRIEE